MARGVHAALCRRHIGSLPADPAPRLPAGPLLAQGRQLALAALEQAEKRSEGIWRRGRRIETRADLGFGQAAIFRRRATGCYRQPDRNRAGRFAPWSGLSDLCRYSRSPPRAWNLHVDLFPCPRFLAHSSWVSYWDWSSASPSASASHLGLRSRRGSRWVPEDVTLRSFIGGACLCGVGRHRLAPDGRSGFSARAGIGSRPRSGSSLARWLAAALGAFVLSAGPPGAPRFPAIYRGKRDLHPNCLWRLPQAEPCFAHVAERKNCRTSERMLQPCNFLIGL